MLSFLNFLDIYVSPCEVFSDLLIKRDIAPMFSVNAASFLALRIFKYMLLFNDLSLTGMPYVEMFFIYSLIKLNHIPSVSSSIKMNWTD